MLLTVSAISFVLLSSAGGDGLSSLRENPQVSEQTLSELREVYGLDRPIPERYGKWLFSAAQGDLGDSFALKVPVATLVWPRFLNTVIMGLTALILGIGIALLLGVLSFLYPGRFLNGCIEILILFSASTPRMVLALAALVLSLRISISAAPAGSLGLAQLAMGSLVLAFPLVSVLLAQIREGLGLAMNEDFVRLAQAKGLSDWRVITRHALRAALNPFLTVSGLSLGALLGGSVIVETVLSWPGIGALMVSAVRSRDVPVVMGVVIVASSAVWLGNTIAEFLQLVNDRRLRETDLPGGY